MSNGHARGRSWDRSPYCGQEGERKRPIACRLIAKMSPVNQLQVVTALRDAIAESEGVAPSLVQTHLSFVLIARDRVYKIKKAVDVGFADFRQLATRREMCERELLLNRRLAASVYLGLAPIGLKDGRAILGASRGVVEYAVVMRRLDERQSLESRVRSGAATAEEVRRVARRLWEFHRANGPARHFAELGSRASLLRNHLENVRQLRPFIGQTIDAAQHQSIRRDLDRFLRCNRALIARRVRDGWVRDCHGDVRAEHVFVEDGVTIIDCIEFADRFRYGDVAGEVAFLAVDLEHLGRQDLAMALVDEYREQSGDARLLDVFDYYAAYRATVRTKVLSMRAAQQEVAEAERARAAAAAASFAVIAVEHAHRASRRDQA